MSNNSRCFKDPYFILILDEFVMGTHKGISESENTLDIPFNDVAQSYALQDKLKLISRAGIRPTFPLLSNRIYGSELNEYVAHFIAAFQTDPEKRHLNLEYMKDNGMLRILFLDENLRNEFTGLVQKINDLKDVHIPKSIFGYSNYSRQGMDLTEMTPSEIHKAYSHIHLAKRG